MEARIHQLELEAYTALPPFEWEKQSLISELRIELRVSYDEHRELKSRFIKDDTAHVLLFISNMLYIGTVSEIGDKEADAEFLLDVQTSQDFDVVPS